MKIDVVLRTMDELQAVIDADPFAGKVDNPTRYFVVFLDAEPEARPLEGEDFTPDDVRRPGHRDLRVVPRGHAGLTPDEGPRQARPRPAPRPCATGRRSTSCWTEPIPKRSSKRRAPASSSVAFTSWSSPSSPELRTSRAWSVGCSPAGAGALHARRGELRRAGLDVERQRAGSREGEREVLAVDAARAVAGAASSRARTSAARASSDSAGGRSGRGSDGCAAWREMPSGRAICGVSVCPFLRARDRRGGAPARPARHEGAVRARRLAVGLAVRPFEQRRASSAGYMGPFVSSTHNDNKGQYGDPDFPET